MPVEYSRESGYAKEMLKWEQHAGVWGVNPGHPYEYREYPMRLYKAARNAEGKMDLGEGRTAENDAERSLLEGQGFVAGGPAEAVAALEREEQYIAKLAAEREWEIQHGRLSDKAVAEVRAEEAAAGSRHLGEIPDAPKRRGWPKGKPRSPQVE